MKSTHSLILITFCFIYNQTAAQRGLYWMGGFELGGNIGSYTFQQKGSVLHQGTNLADNDNDNDGNGDRKGYHHVLKTAFYYRLSRHFGLEGGLQRSYISVPLRDVNFQSKYSITPDAGENNVLGNFTPSISYDAGYFAAHYFCRDRYNLGAQFYFGGGATFNKLSVPSSHHTYAYQYSPTGEILTLTAQIPMSYVSPFIDAGIFFYNPHYRRRSFVSLRYSFAPTLLAAGYRNMNGNMTQYQDYVTFTGNSLSLNYSLGINLTKPYADRQLYTARTAHHSSHLEHRTLPAPSTKNATHDVLKAELLGCLGYDKSTKASFWIYERKTRYFLEKLDSDLDRMFVHELNLRSDLSGLGKHDWVFVRAAMLKDNLTLVTLSGNAESTEKKITIHQFRLDGRENGAPLTAFRLRGSIQNYVNVAWSPDSTKFTVFVFEPKQKNLTQNKALVRTFDHKLQQLYSIEANFDTSNTIAEPEIALNNKGDIFVLGESYGAKTPLGYHVWMLRSETKKITELRLPVQNIAAARLEKNVSNELAITGFTNDRCPIANSCTYTGTFYGKIDGATKQIENLKTAKFQGVRPEISQSSSRVRIFNTLKCDVGSRGRYLSSEMIKFSAAAEAHGSVFIAHLDKRGNLRSTTLVRKYQFHYGMARPRHHGYFSWVNDHESSWHMIYYGKRMDVDTLNYASVRNNEDQKTRKKALVLVSIDSLGNLTKRLLLPKDSTRVVWFPASSYQINDHEFFMIGKKSGKFTVCRVAVR